MKEVINIFKVIFVFSTLLSCNSDDPTVDEDQIIENDFFIKSEKAVNSDFDHLDRFFEFENGLLKKASGFTPYSGEYIYDNTGKLIQIQRNSEFYTFEYDNEGRIIRETEENGENYTEFIYENNEVTTNRYYYLSGNQQVISRKLTFDNAGRIARYERLTPTSSFEWYVEKYQYDIRGNLVQIRSEQNNHGDLDKIENLEYDNFKNPYFYSLSELVRTHYVYLFQSGIGGNNRDAISPNNILTDGYNSFLYVYNEEGFPVGWTNSTDSGISEFTIEYH